MLAISSLVLSLSPAIAATNDLNSDGNSDLLFVDSAGGLTARLMNGLGAGATAGLLPAGSGWNVTHTADFNADGKTDILFKHTDGSVYVYLMNGLSVVEGKLLLGPNADWLVTHVADVNGDGKADLIFKNANGSVFVYLMNGASVAAGAFILGSGTGWSVTHFGDLNADGKADLFLRHTDGSVYGYIMNGLSVAGGKLFLGANTVWELTHVADLNGDGTADMLLRYSNGSVFAYLMNGTNFAGGAYLLVANTGWSITHFGDVNADGKADLLLKHTDGSVYLYMMNGLTVSSGKLLLGPNAVWEVTHVADLNGDGKDDVLFKNTDGSVFSYLMDGVNFLSGGFLAPAASSLRVVPGANRSSPAFNRAPTISITAPASGAATMVGVATTITVNASDANGTITRVEFFDSGAKIGESATPPFTITWLPGAEGGRTLTARAMDNGGAVTRSSAVSVNVSASPTINAARLLAQTTFGATKAEIDRVANLGLDVYIEEQFQTQPTSHLTTVRNDPDYPASPWSVMSPSIWKQYFEANDQLRQRVVFALSQILVISLQNNTIGDQPCGPAAYLDMLGRHAFGNFRDILKDMTLSPAMGQYLDMKQSAKADPVLNSVPNENYARELLQLFSIGTVMLNIDGSSQFVSGKTVDTYSEATVQEFARALTGWTFANQDQTKDWRWLYPDVPFPNPSNPGSAEQACVTWSTPMQPWSAPYRSADNTRTIQGGAHDTGAKTLLDYPGAANFKRNVPANQTAMQDLDAVVDNVFNHPNVGPFISEQLIQRLVTSNPSGAYVARVASVFNNNGAGVRGDMKSVIRAILLDPESRASVGNQPPSFGKLREPVVRFTHLHRAFGARMQNGMYKSIYDLGGSDSLGQSPLRAPSVFNFYHPDFAPTGPISQGNLVGPEFEITNSATISGFMDFSKYGIVGGFGQYESDTGKWLKPNYDSYIALAASPAAMVDQLSTLLLAGSMSSQLRSQLIDVATKLTDSNVTTQNTERFKTVLWLILNSPEYSIQK